ncbi:unnamed protein product [Ceutorhynchus assimilis]|uniref:CBP80/20-dependent translation initiation factor n=1 Tax=Ceutorhynchus assimilis TaxID=467358 RepID=A0A9N9MH76_9CUCU|nr:unnamed protein product [Ceutorhynchus assimilis]
MSGGIGRGRGWLKLKSQDIKNPGSESPSTLANDASQQFSDACEDYAGLISEIKQLNINDDGIKFNQKIRHILESWNEECQNAMDVEKSFESIHSASLRDSEMATKLVLLIASRTFLSQEVHGTNIRLMFLRRLQNSFEECAQIKSTDPHAFRNSVQLMGEFYNKARLANGQQFAFMATPLLSYFEMLLESVDPLDFKLFTIQLYLNGSSLRHECPEKVANIISKVRYMLCSEETYTRECKLWLILAMEVSSNRFALLPADVHNFYQNELGDHAMACFQGSHATLTVQTNPNKTLDTFHSNVNVLQVSTDSGYQNNSVSDVSTNNSSSIHNDSSLNYTENKEPQSNNKAKPGRPILGIGARLQRSKVPPTETNPIEFTWEPQNNSNISQPSNVDPGNHQASNMESTSRQPSNMDPPASNTESKTRPMSNTDSSSHQEARNRQTSSIDSRSRQASSTDSRNRQGPAVNHKDSRSRQNGPSNGKWRENNQGKKDWEKKKSPSMKKGWEHDDRFDNDYS